MDTRLAFALGDANRGKEEMVFDWDKAAKILKERRPVNAKAGLQDDLEWTSGYILMNGKPCKTEYTYLSSTWATPLLVIDGEEIPCFKMQHEVSKWNAETKWPKSALDIFYSKE